MLITKSFLLIVDLQRGFLNKETKSVLNVIENAKKKLKYDACIYTKFYNEKNTSFSKILNWNRLQSESEQEIVISIEEKDMVLKKNTYSAVTEELKKIIYDNAYKKAYICGIDTDSCVLATAFELFDIGVEPSIIIDGCASTGGYDCHSAAELIMRRSFGNDNVNNLSYYIGGN